MNQRTFRRLRDIVYEESGISLSAAKQPLLMARTAKRLRALGLSSYEEYLGVVESDGSGVEIVELLDAISTNVTSFFREPEHFEAVRLHLEEVLRRGRRRLRAWSAGCSSGEEPYSLAMTMLDAAAGITGDVRVLATDINTRVLETGRRGVYPDVSVRTVPPRLRRRYLQRTGTRDERSWAAGEELRRTVAFKRLNLARPPYRVARPLDIVFCRNVMIYFDQPVRERLLAELHRVLRPGGLLVVGHAESLAARSTMFKLISPSVLTAAPGLLQGSR